MSVHVVTDETIDDVLASHDKVAIKYFANWCGSCKLFAPKYRRLSDDERFSDIHFIDVNAEENPKTRKLASVNNLPYFAVFKNGKLEEGAATSKEEIVVELLNKLS
ncbi:MAG: thioredoxin [Bacteroidetes bacterium]|nr:thioredoxin [Bacteroidota bacterium]